MVGSNRQDTTLPDRTKQLRDKRDKDLARVKWLTKAAICNMFGVTLSLATVKTILFNKGNTVTLPLI